MKKIILGKPDDSVIYPTMSNAKDGIIVRKPNEYTGLLYKSRNGWSVQWFNGEVTHTNQQSSVDAIEDLLDVQYEVYQL